MARPPARSAVRRRPPPACTIPPGPRRERSSPRAVRRRAWPSRARPGRGRPASQREVRSPARRSVARARIGQRALRSARAAVSGHHVRAQGLGRGADRRGRVQGMGVDRAVERGLEERIVGVAEVVHGSGLAIVVEDREADLVGEQRPGDEAGGVGVHGRPGLGIELRAEQRRAVGGEARPGLEPVAEERARANLDVAPLHERRAAEDPSGVAVEHEAAGDGERGVGREDRAAVAGALDRRRPDLAVVEDGVLDEHLRLVLFAGPSAGTPPVPSSRLVSPDAYRQPPPLLLSPMASPSTARLPRSRPRFPRSGCGRPRASSCRRGSRRRPSRSDRARARWCGCSRRASRGPSPWRWSPARARRRWCRRRCRRRHSARRAPRSRARPVRPRRCFVRSR